MPDPCALDRVSARDSVASFGTRPTSQQLRLAADVPRSRQQPSPGLSALDRHRIPGDPGRGGPGLSPSNSDTHLARSVCQRPVRRPPARPDDGADGHRWRRAPDPSPGGHTDRAVGQPCSRPIARSVAVTERRARMAVARLDGVNALARPRRTANPLAPARRDGGRTYRVGGPSVRTPEQVCR